MRAAGRPELRVGVVGSGWMGQVQARALVRVLHHYPDPPYLPRLAAVADTAPVDHTRRVAEAHGFEHVLEDWRHLIVRDDVDLVCVTGPNAIQRDVAVAATRAGKHVWVEKGHGARRSGRRSDGRGDGAVRRRPLLDNPGRTLPTPHPSAPQEPLPQTSGDIR